MDETESNPHQEKQFLYNYWQNKQDPPYILQTQQFALE